MARRLKSCLARKYRAGLAHRADFCFDAHFALHKLPGPRRTQISQRGLPLRFQAFPINEFGHMAVLRTAVICSSPVRQPPANWLTRDTCDRSSGYHRLRARVYAHNRATCHIRHIG
jgi:hypothetical protein